MSEEIFWRHDSSWFDKKKLDDHMKLNKKDDKKIQLVLKYFRKGFIVGIKIFLVILIVLLIIEGVKWLKQF